jgi:hypothetical protein
VALIGVETEGETEGGLNGECKPTLHFTLKKEIEEARCEGCGERRLGAAEQSRGGTGGWGRG